MQKRKRTNFNETQTNQLPKLGKIKTEWDLKKYYYRSHNDPQIEKDVKKDEKAFSEFAKKYQNKNFTKNTSSLKQALDDYKKLLLRPNAARAALYFFYRMSLNAQDTDAEKMANLLEARLSRMFNEVVFFELAIGKILKKDQKRFLGSGELSEYRYFLERVFLEAKHHLTEPEERIINLLAQPSHSMWEAMTEKMLGSREVTFEGRKLPLNEALVRLEELSPAKKRTLWNLITAEIESISEATEHELNAIVTRKKISDSLRGYTKPYDSTAISYETQTKTIESIVDAVSSKGFELSSRFYKLKAKLHKQKKIDYVNKYDPIRKDNLKLSLDDAVTTCRETFYSLNPEYGKFFDETLTTGRTDVYPKKGKRGGAFMMYETGHPIMVFLNHSDTPKSFTTLAHEMGHGVHFFRSKKHAPFYDSCTLLTAETASTLFENLAFEKLLEQATESQRKFLLHDKIAADIAAIERQIAFFNFELEMHKRIREEGAMTRKELAATLQKHLKSYLGPAVNVTETDGYSYVYVGHFRANFYVYTYAFGHLVSGLMIDNYKADPNYAHQIDQFLSAGSTDTAENIFKSIGIDVTKPETFLKGLVSHEANINELEKLTRKR